MKWFILIFAFISAFGASTQHFASNIQYDERFLGTPLFYMGDDSYKIGIYSPFKFFTWWNMYHEYVPEHFTIGYIALAVIFSFFLLWILKKPKILDSHGTARWAYYDDLLKMDLISGSGVLVGLYDPKWKQGLTKILRFLETQKNEKVSYAEIAFDKVKDKKLDYYNTLVPKLEAEIESCNNEERKKQLTKRLTTAQDYIHNPPKFNIKNAGPITRFYAFLHKRFSKFYVKIPHFYLRDNSNKHVAVIAPTRSGKGVGLIIPTLLGGWKSSVIVNDIKSENWGVTAGYRKRMGHLAIKFEPTASDGSSARWNPLDEIPIGNPLEVSMAQNLAAVLADYEGKGKPDHWTANAANVIMAVILHMKYAHFVDPEHYPHPPTLYTVANFMKAFFSEEVDPETGQQKFKVRGFIDTLKNLQGFEHVPDEGIDIKYWDKDKEEYAIRHFTPNDLKALYPTAQSIDIAPNIHPIIFQAFAEITSKPDNELGSIVSTANTALKEYLDPVLAENTSISDFCIDDLMNYKKPISLFLVTPPSDLLRLAPIFRLFFEMMVRHHARSIGTYINGQAKSNYKHKCLFLMDEFSSLGNLQSFAATLSYIAGYGMKVFLINQGLPQINGIYGKDNQILMNCHLQIFYAPNDNDTAKYAETLLGNKTILVKNKSKNGNSFFGGTSTSTNATARALMTSDELKRLGDKEIIVASGSQPVLTDKIKYYEHEYFLKRLVNAPVVSDIVRNVPSHYNPKREELIAKDKLKQVSKYGTHNNFVYETYELKQKDSKRFRKNLKNSKRV